MLIGALLVYSILIALPFVPGIEIGVTLLMIRGADIAPMVYLATVLGLLLAFMAGCFLKYEWLERIFRDLRLTSACAFLENTAKLDRDARFDVLRDRLPSWLAESAIRFRYFTLAILLNLPGNAVIGGGGGICLLAGLSRLFSVWQVVLTIILAVLPVPAMVWLFGTGILGN